MPMTFHDLATSPIGLFLLGVAVSYLGYGPLSRKKNPRAGVAFVGVGFFCRVAGPLILLWVGFLLLFVISMTRPPVAR
jgi:hypothetical protein